jgi:hypothetical protein
MPHMAALRYGLFVLLIHAWLLVSLIHQNGGPVVVFFMIQFSRVVPFLGLQYHETSLDSRAQTVRLGQARPVSRSLGSCRSPANLIAFVQD